jgi:hypothetical protein
LKIDKEQDLEFKRQRFQCTLRNDRPQVFENKEQKELDIGSSFKNATLDALLSLWMRPVT